VKGSIIFAFFWDVESRVVFAPRLPAFALVFFDNTGMTMVYNVGVRGGTEQGRNRCCPRGVLSGDRSIQSEQQEEKRRWDGAHGVSYMTSWSASLLSSEFQSSSLSVQSYSYSTGSS